MNKMSEVEENFKAKAKNLSFKNSSNLQIQRPLRFNKSIGKCLLYFVTLNLKMKSHKESKILKNIKYFLNQVQSFKKKKKHLLR